MEEVIKLNIMSLDEYIDSQIKEMENGNALRESYAMSSVGKQRNETKAERKKRWKAFMASERFEDGFRSYLKRNRRYKRFTSENAIKTNAVVKEYEKYAAGKKESILRPIAKERAQGFIRYLARNSSVLIECTDRAARDVAEEYLQRLSSDRIYLYEELSIPDRTLCDFDDDDLKEDWDDDDDWEDYRYGYGRYEEDWGDDGEDEELCPDNVEEFLAGIEEHVGCSISDGYIAWLTLENSCNYLKEHDKENYDTETQKAYEGFGKEDSHMVRDAIIDGFRSEISGMLPSVEEAITNLPAYYVTEDKARTSIGKNPYYIKKVEEKKEARRAAERERAKQRRLEQGILDAIPENPIDLYPLARKMERKWILHIGPTNSGKTYGAMQALEAADRGVYLAPLRLLAFEAYSRMNADGIPCSLITGEEERITEGASHTAATVEMLDTMAEYDVAVVDEAQMAGDAQRGGAWTAALLGVRAREIHVCAAPYVEGLLLKLAELCGDKAEVIRHERQVPLTAEAEDFRAKDMAKSVQDGDALIVFSKRSVLAVAAALQKDGVSCSVIYGALPYEVRQNEAEKFAKGETKVVVTTDAIGMGMNLPIRRVVFLEQTKYDGKEERPLLPAEIQQIAGRAGRRGMFDEGYYVTSYNTQSVRKHCEAVIAPIDTAYLGFDRALVDVDGKLSEVMEKWQEMENPGVYKKQDLEEQVKLCREIEDGTDDKHLVFRFVTIPFRTDNAGLHGIWLSAFRMELSGRHLAYQTPSYIVNDLQSLEDAYGYCDLLYYYRRRFTDGAQLEQILKDKKEITGHINRILAKQELKGRKCKYCNRELPWNYAYGMCQDCHDDMYGSRWEEEYGWY